MIAIGQAYWLIKNQTRCCMETNDHMCPVCGYPDLDRQPRTEENGGSYEICVSCGFQFGVSDDDSGYTDESWRAAWIADGMKWRSVATPQPPGWEPKTQLKSTGFAPPADARVR